jgi:hypothetical protein
MEKRKYLSKQRAADYLDVCTKTIDRLRLAGELDWIHVGSGVRVSAASLGACEQRQARRLAAAGAEPFAIRALDELRAEKAAQRLSRRPDGEQAA